MLAIIQNADTPQIESSAEMLRSAGYDEIKVCGKSLRDELQRIGCDTVLAVKQMISMGYDSLEGGIGEASLEDVDRCDLFCEIKVRNVPKIVERWPRLKGRIAYWRVNGAQPEICPKGGDEVNLPCPIITACLWYGTDRYRAGRSTQHQSDLEHLASRSITLDDLKREAATVRRHDPSGMCYVFWPPYPRKAVYTENARLSRTKSGHYDAAYGVAHYMPAWGYGPIVNQVADLGVHLYGDRAPRGQIPHSVVGTIAQTALALVHLKSVDCPGWALYEALLSGCPVITPRLMNSRMLGYELLEDGVTCLEFGVPASLEYGRGDMAYEQCVADIAKALDRLRDPAENRRIGESGKQRLLDLMWSKDKAEDVSSFQEFCERNFAR